MNVLFARSCNDKFFVRPSDLADAANAGLIRMQVGKPMDFGRNFIFTTHSGLHIATIYKDDQCGFSSQAYGCQISAQVLVTCDDEGIMELT